MVGFGFWEEEMVVVMGLLADGWRKLYGLEFRKEKKLQEK